MGGTAGAVVEAAPNKNAFGHFLFDSAKRGGILKEIHLACISYSTIFRHRGVYIALSCGTVLRHPTWYIRNIDTLPKGSPKTTRIWWF